MKKHLIILYALLCILFIFNGFILLKYVKLNKLVSSLSETSLHDTEMISKLMDYLLEHPIEQPHYIPLQPEPKHVESSSEISERWQHKETIG